MQQIFDMFERNICAAKLETCAKDYFLTEKYVIHAVINLYADVDKLRHDMFVDTQREVAGHNYVAAKIPHDIQKI